MTVVVLALPVSIHVGPDFVLWDPVSDYTNCYLDELVDYPILTFTNPLSYVGQYPCQYPVPSGVYVLYCYLILLVLSHSARL